MKRGGFLAAGLSAALTGCSAVGTKLNDSAGFRNALDKAEGLDERVIGTRGRARLYTAADISREFPIDSFATPSGEPYAALARTRFRGYRLPVTGEIERPQIFTIAALYALEQQTQITRHDCVEGWSAIAQWGGVPLATLLRMVQPKALARFVVFRCFDRDTSGTPYYESLSLEQAAHPQTLLALRQNGAPIVPDRGAPVRLTIPTQLGYKSAKWIRQIEVVSSLAPLYGGKGGYWEDQGYEWYAGI